MARKSQYVRCLVSLGFFPTEFYVMVDDSSAYVGKDNVKLNHTPEASRPVEGAVLAVVVDESADRALIELPGQPAVGGLRTWVQKDRLLAL